MGKTIGLNQGRGRGGGRSIRKGFFPDVVALLEGMGDFIDDVVIGGGRGSGGFDQFGGFTEEPNAGSQGIVLEKMVDVW
jgi:hypothetical protein